MPYESTRISQLKEMLKLEERRASLQSEIDQLDQRIAALGGAVLGRSAAPSAAPVSAPRRGRPPKAAGAGGRQRRGGLKDKILSALEAAGKEGVTVRELADEFGTKPQNIFSWFNNTGKKNPNIRKIGQAKYRLEGSGKPAAAPASASAGRGRKPKSSNKPAGKATSGQAATPKRPKRGGSARGELREKILGALKSAGSTGITVKELSEKLGVNYKNISIWFSTTGRKHSEIEKVGPARYTIA